MEAHAFADNAPILRVMEKVGLRHEGIFKEESLHRTRGWVDGVTYAMLARSIGPGADGFPPHDAQKYATL